MGFWEIFIIVLAVALVALTVALPIIRRVKGKPPACSGGCDSCLRNCNVKKRSNIDK